MTDRKKNAYYCGVCSRYTVTIDVDEGVTPMFLGCRATEGCVGMAESMMYHPEPWPPHVPTEPTFEWYKPTLKWARRKGPEWLDHVRKGGLAIRPIAK